MDDDWDEIMSNIKSGDVHKIPIDIFISCYDNIRSIYGYFNGTENMFKFDQSMRKIDGGYVSNGYYNNYPERNYNWKMILENIKKGDIHLIPLEICIKYYDQIINIYKDYHNTSDISLLYINLRKL